MKKLILFFFFLNQTFSFSQEIRGFGSFGASVLSNFTKTNYVNIGVGIEVNAFRFLKPEVEFKVIYAPIPIITNYDNLGFETEQIFYNLWAYNISIAPKFHFREEDEDWFVNLYPIYNVTKINASYEYFVINPKTGISTQNSSDKVKESRHSAGFGVSFGFDFQANPKNSLSFNLNFNNIELGNALKKLPRYNGDFSSKNAISFGIAYYFGFKKK